MQRPADTDIQALAQRLRVPMALNHGPVGPTEAGHDLAAWIAGAEGVPADAELFLTIDGGLERAEVTMGGESHTMFDALEVHLELLGATKSDVETVRALGTALMPSAVSVWLEAGPDGIEAGYGLHGALPAKTALGLLRTGDAGSRLASFLEVSGLTHLGETRVSVGPGIDAALFRIPLPEGADTKALAAGCAEALELDPFAPAVIDTLVEGAATTELVIGLTTTSVYAFAVAADTQDTATAITLLGALGGVDGDVLASFEGTLGVDHAVSMQVWRDARGERLRLTYGPLDAA